MRIRRGLALFLLGGVVGGGVLWGEPVVPVPNPSATTVKAFDGGINITVPGMAPFTLSNPILEGEKVVSAQSNGTTATLTYDAGTKIVVNVAENGTVNYHLSGLPATVKKVELQLPLGADYAKGGVYRVNDAEPVPFPATTPADPQICKHNNSNRLAIHDAEERSLVMHLPGHSYLQIEDWRGKPEDVFVARIISPIMSPDMSLHVGDPPATRSAANQPPITIPFTKTPMTVGGNPEQWEKMTPIKLDATREVGGQDGPTQHAPSWAIPKSLEGKEADVSGSFRLCWDDKNLYVRVDVIDPTPLQNPNAANSLWAGDAIELFIGSKALDQGGDLLPSDRQVMLGADAKLGSRTYVRGVVSQPTFPSVAGASPGGYNKGYSVEAAIPFSELGFIPKKGMKLRFDIGIDDSVDGKGRHAQLMWNGTNQNSNERTKWGWAVLGE